MPAEKVRRIHREPAAVSLNFTERVGTEWCSRATTRAAAARVTFILRVTECLKETLSVTGLVMIRKVDFMESGLHEEYGCGCRATRER